MDRKCADPTTDTTKVVVRRLTRKGSMLYNRAMYKVINKNNMSLCECDTLDDSMKFARSWAGFVTIQGPDFEVCGVFGVDSVVDGRTPDGVAYTWNKASRIGKTRK